MLWTFDHADYFYVLWRLSLILYGLLLKLTISCSVFALVDYKPHISHRFSNAALKFSQTTDQVLYRR